MQQSNPPERIYFLAKKWQSGSITDEERIEFEAWYVDFDNSLEIKTDKSRSAMELRLYQQIAKKGNISSKSAFQWTRFAAAASILLVLGVAGFYFARWNKSDQMAKIETHDVAPGSNKAILTLANGQKILLAGARNGRLAVQGNVLVTKASDGSIAYAADGNQSANSSDISYNTISTPAGGQYHLTLADGTNAWLNAGSSIKYPTSFTGSERKVEITGEVYFEVAHNRAQPFRVISNRQVVEVLGTHFNVNSYPDEEDIRTTLLEGSVKVTGSDHIIVIKPGEQAILGKNGLAAAPADLEETVAWKNGYFRFNDEKIGSIMRKLSRWYDIKVTFKGPISDEGFNGKISRYKNISQALRMLEKTKAVQFQIEGRRVTVMQ